MLDLLIINPNSRSKVYQGLGDDLAAIEPPLWCRLIAGYLRHGGFSVRVIDAEAEALNAESVAIRARSFNPFLIAVVVFGHQPSASTQQMIGAGAACRAVSGIASRGTILIGGHVSALPVRTLEEEAADFACVGEGPKTIEALLRLKPAHDVPGLVWRDSDGSILQNERAPLMALSELHGRAWDLLPMSRYRAHNWQCFDGSPRQPYASIYTSLGCPFTCSFCCINAPFGANRYRMREPADVIAEIRMLRDAYGVRMFKISDEMFVLNERHYTAICAGLADIGADLNIWAYARIDTVKPEKLAMLRAAGVRWLALGIEAASDAVRDGAEKHFSRDDIVSTVRAVQAAGIAVIGNFIFGLPGDTAAAMTETLNLAKELRCEFANFYSAMAYPGSPLYDTARSDGKRLPDKWSGYSQHSVDSLPLATDRLTSEEILDFRDCAFDDYFRDPDYLGMVQERFGPLAVAQIQRMTATTLHRRHRELVHA